MAQTYTKEKIDELIAGAEGTEVIANPTLAGTESALTGLQVGDTKYKVEAGGGSDIYLVSFNISIAPIPSSGSESVYISFYAPRSFTGLQEVLEYIKDYSYGSPFPVINYSNFHFYAPQKQFYSVIVLGIAKRENNLIVKWRGTYVTLGFANNDITFAGGIIGPSSTDFSSVHDFRCIKL